MSPTDANQYLHWYNFCFVHTEDGQPVFSSKIAGLTQNRVNEAVIDEVKAADAVPASAVLVSVSYLGCMPPAVFHD